MTTRRGSRRPTAPTGPGGARAGRRTLLALAVGAAGLYGLAAPTGALSKAGPTGELVAHVFPVGVPDPLQPSGKALPGPLALPGYHLVYQNDFATRGVPAGWDVFTGIPSTLTDDRFAAAEVQFRAGMLILNSRPSTTDPGTWLTAGLCQCGAPLRYGAFFVRSRDLGGGANEVQLLWPTHNAWLPELDFNETLGHTNLTTSTTHWSAGGLPEIVQKAVTANMSRWHTWGVVWTPTSVSYVLDGRVWASMNNPHKIPHVPMTLDFEQRVRCYGTFAVQCPTKPVHMYVDWVAEYQRA